MTDRTTGLDCTEQELDLYLAAHSYRALIESNKIPMNLDPSCVALLVQAEQKMRDFVQKQPDLSVFAGTINKELGLTELASGAEAANKELDVEVTDM